METNRTIFDSPAIAERLISYFTEPQKGGKNFSIKEGTKDTKKATAEESARNHDGKRP